MLQLKDTINPYERVIFFIENFQLISNDIYPDIISIDNMDMYADNNANKYNICDGVIRFDRFYVNVQEGSIIGSTFFYVNDYSVTKY